MKDRDGNTIRLLPPAARCRGDCYVARSGWPHRYTLSYFAIDPKSASTSSCCRFRRRVRLPIMRATAISISEVQAIFSISPLRVKTLMEAKSNCKCFLQFRTRVSRCVLIFETRDDDADATACSKFLFSARSRVCSDHHPHLESPQLKHVMHPSILMTALVEHLVQSCASAGKSPRASSVAGPLLCSASARLAAMNFF